MVRVPRPVEPLIRKVKYARWIGERSSRSSLDRPKFVLDLAAVTKASATAANVRGLVVVWAAAPAGEAATAQTIETVQTATLAPDTSVRCGLEKRRLLEALGSISQRLPSVGTPGTWSCEARR
jgi:hypothetical protein